MQNFKALLKSKPGVQKVNIYDIVWYVAKNCRLICYDKAFKMLFKFGTETKFMNLLFLNMFSDLYHEIDFGDMALQKEWYGYPV